MTTYSIISVMAAEYLARSAKMSSKRQQSLSAKFVNSRFRLTSKLGIQTAAEKDLALWHLELRVLRHRRYHINRFVSNPLVQIDPRYNRFGKVTRKQEQLSRIEDDIVLVENLIDQKQTAIYEAQPDTQRPRMIEMAINMFMSGGDSFFGRNMGTTLFRRRKIVKEWKNDWRERLQIAE